MLPPEVLKQVKGNSCFWCGRAMLAIPMDKEGRLPKAERYKIKTMDHLIARSQGGGRFCVAACLLCNSLKGSMHPREFRERFRRNVCADLLERLIGHAETFGPASKAIRDERRKQYERNVYLQGYSTQ